MTDVHVRAEPRTEPSTGSLFQASKAWGFILEEPGGNLILRSSRSFQSGPDALHAGYLAAKAQGLNPTEVG